MEDDRYYSGQYPLPGGFEEYQRILQRVIDRQPAPPSTEHGQRKIVFLGGQMGSGKTTLRPLIIATRFDDEPVIIDPDDLRTEHPRYSEAMRDNDKTANIVLHPFADKLAKDLLAWALLNGRNIVVDKTLRNADKTSNALASIPGGYHKEVIAVAENEDKSRQNCLYRYWSMKHATRFRDPDHEDAEYRPGHGRYTPIDKHDQAYQGLPLTVARVEQDKACNNIAIYRSSNISPHLRNISKEGMHELLDTHLVYENSLEDGEWRIPPQGREKLVEERERPFTEHKIRAYHITAEQIDSWLTQYNASEVDRLEAKLLAKEAELKFAREENEKLKDRANSSNRFAKYKEQTDSDTLKEILAHHEDPDEEFIINDITNKNGLIPKAAEGFCFGGGRKEERKFVLISRDMETGNLVYTVISRQQASLLGRMVMYEKDIRNRTKAKHKHKDFKPVAGARNGVLIPPHRFNHVNKSGADIANDRVKAIYDRAKGNLKLIRDEIKEAGENVITKAKAKRKR